MVGDFNTQYDSDAQYSQKFKSLLASCNLNQLVDFSTHIHGHILDFIITFSDFLGLSQIQQNAYVSCHFSTVCNLDCDYVHNKMTSKACSFMPGRARTFILHLLYFFQCKCKWLACILCWLSCIGLSCVLAPSVLAHPVLGFSQVLEMCLFLMNFHLNHHLIS